MNRHYWLMMLLLSIILLGGVCLATMSKDEFLDYLEARDTSISSYSLDMQRANFKIAFEDYDLLKDFVKKANRMEMGKLEPSDVIDELIQHVGANDVFRLFRLRQIVLERGEHFKSTQTIIKTGRVEVRHYDGELYRVYSAKSGQLAIHPSILQVGRGSLSDFGIGYIGSGKTWPRPTITDFEQRPDGTLCVHQAIEDGVTYAAEYDTNLNLKYGYYLEGGEKVQEFWDLGHDEFGGCSIPRVRLETWPSKDGHSVWCRVLGDVKINCPISDADLAMPKMGPRTIVTDYRHKPTLVTQLIDYPNEILRDELMLDEPSKSAAELTPPAEAEVLQEQEAQSNPPEQTEKAPPDAEGEQATQADSQANQEDLKIVGSQTGSKWSVVLVFLIVAAAAGLVGVAVCRQRKYK